MFLVCVHITEAAHNGETRVGFSKAIHQFVVGRRNDEVDRYTGFLLKKLFDVGSVLLKDLV